ncbi:hypothetical protein AJ85_02915 [Alkalihalobacillus alcalophilus ATCC 27647 = CGMCC 1.3604]|uniref:DUF2268 domain-containing protein n=1 Tax=Alkalihalobacillus alcalophilus ATCC 27647 = CGMCC 1.3604 TaxID=1218173 RepID=A0A094YV01_ALKAL|nr:DUF2268 domain-containing putative Zn-dependent protease [Alkalihalobacillus alcalophilus]KGA97337.1 hypothetical protein BALCAV_0211060 [Alkalihalobacillus alcalophilus ATCC 27647 = CGMCC 1.3604]MED1561240.1 DUF2268 domain-containing putative Zn-dependent protease [Alkalihalobacillus alcalophilus]THG91713.1 hypothetical protein AJ85_02915 [Alkalihalobacillus alcalophilus ATCC 27647 = CGMCC 1.3604]
MGVVRTDKWLQYYLKYWKEKKNAKERYEWQQRMLITPIIDYFKNHKIEEVHRYFLDLGLSNPETDLTLMEEDLLNKKWWSVTQNKFLQLRKEWTGPDVPIFIFPIERAKEHLWREVGGKTGLSTDMIICLFIDPNINEEQLLALIVHEYHHVCRLAVTNNKEEEVSLLESILMEGLAEAAVKEELGKDALAPWVEQYRLSDCLPLFNNHYREHLKLKGRNYYRHLLNGDTREGIPRMLGYSIGFYMVESVIQKFALTTLDLLKMDTWSIYKKSIFFEESN